VPVRPLDERAPFLEKIPRDHELDVVRVILMLADARLRGSCTGCITEPEIAFLLGTHDEIHPFSAAQLDHQLAGLLRKIKESSRRRNFYLAFSQSPVDFINALIASQVLLLCHSVACILVSSMPRHLQSNTARDLGRARTCQKSVHLVQELVCRRGTCAQHCRRRWVAPAQQLHRRPCADLSSSMGAGWRMPCFAT
jgi:hypothetical protein